MKHKFRKYISKRGSALFMVLSVMTALIVTSLAMYFSVVSSRKTQYAIFNQQQSYQSALSLSESLLGGIIQKTDDANMSGMQALANAVNAMSVGDTITTSGNGFYSFDASGTRIDEDQVGAYIADITFLSENSEGKLFDFAVTTMVNGTESTVHQYVLLGGEIRDPGSPQKRPLPLFVASGLIPTSPALNAGYMFSDVFYDSEYTHFMPYGAEGDKNGNAELKTFGNVYTAGSLTINFNLSDADAKSHVNGAVNAKPHNWIIRKDLIMTNNMRAVNFNEPDSTMYPDQNNRIVVGGDLIFKSNSMGFKNCEIYVLGNVTIEDGANLGENVKIYALGSVNGSVSGINVSAQGGCSFDRNSYAQEIEYYTNDLQYFDWNEWDSDTNTYKYGRPARACDGEKEIDEHGNPIIYPIEGMNKIVGNKLVNHVKAHFVRTAGTPDAQFVWAPDRQGYVITGVDGINEYETTGGTFSYNNHQDPGYKLVIDTGDNPENVLTIRLEGYLDGGKTFSWCPYYGDYATWVIVKGKGSVVFLLDDGVTYENKSYKTNVMHENWTSNGAFGSQDTRDQVKNLITQKWIHYECGDDCCVNALVAVEGKTCGTCGGQLYNLKCDEHRLNKMVCLDDGCDGKSFNWREKDDGTFESYSTCQYRINKKGNNDNDMTPTMNIFLVMCGQSSTIQFTPPASVMTTNGINESFSSFWGYIYAPYAPLNYSAKLQSGDKIQFVGGIAVGSFNLYGRNSYMPAYPDRLPEEVMPYAAKLHELPSVDGKPWKEALSSPVSG